MNIEIGQSIGGYKITGRLGSGGMAAVYEADHTKLGRSVAIKVMHAGFQHDDDLLARFRREARVVAQLDHPNIVPVYDFDEHNGAPYLVMKRIRGQSLKLHLRRRVLALEEIDQICTAIANALTYAHSQGVLHRDVKPGNVMLDENGTPYLTDFGLARVVTQGESSLSAGMIVGTPHYLSPEQASGELEIGPGADVYALGVMLYEMVVGRVPFSAESTHAIVHDHIYTPPPPPSEANPEIPVEVERVLLRALEKDPADRYSSPSALMDDFHTALSSSGLTALSEDRSEIASRSIAQMRAARKPKAKATVPSKAWSPESEKWHDETQVDVDVDLGRVMGEVDSALRDVLPTSLEDAWKRVKAPFQKNDNKPYRPPTENELESQIRERVTRRLRARNVWQGHAISFVVISMVLFFVPFVARDMIIQAIMKDVTAGTMPIQEADMAITWATKPWTAVIILWWAGGLAAHRSTVRNLSARNEDRRERRLLSYLSNAYGPDWETSITQGQYNAARDAVSRRFCAVAAFRGHFWMFIWGNLGLALAWSNISAGLFATSVFVAEVEGNVADAAFLEQMASSPMFLIITAIWSVSLLIHGLRTGSGRHLHEAKELARERELTLSRQTPRPVEKNKNNNVMITLGDAEPAVRLNEDGELTNSTVEAWGKL